MGVNLGDIFKEHKKIILGTLGIVALVLILGVVLSSGSNLFTLSNDLTGGGVDDLVNNGGNGKTYSSLPAMQIDTSKDYTAVMYTDYGQIDIDLFEKDTPITVNNFAFLVGEGFYDGLTFHRVIKDFVIQGGDPKGTGEGNPGYSFEDEIDADALGLGDLKVSEATYLRSFYSSSQINANSNLSVKDFYEKLGYKYTNGKGTTKFAPYVLAMANSGPATNGSQFFITTRGFTGDYLNGKHTVFGRVTSGFNTVDKIEAVNVNSSGKPTATIKIKEIKIVEK
ncbi:MAG: Peptidyl-prolyl cis-trans isomerase, cyclophilin-type [candidate division WS6 bacterium GW2011_GWF2_39_15]|uniref:Peptidyl-prolyl cis-trans isomerase n=1 Tax=candidate division WS6 bacterium GW2011_GWF2_39_15 TaxID=1619100 RepID=A0A0G0MQV6_9BACT|nr:MAG: Peptidyl-prolyl cis-trans isomerase, cyclophilin-type [candidate division WS6 bacterium GW2011_GWF2_39_15]